LSTVSRAFIIEERSMKRTTEAFGVLPGDHHALAVKIGKLAHRCIKLTRAGSYCTAVIFSISALHLHETDPDDALQKNPLTNVPAGLGTPTQTHIVEDEYKNDAVDSNEWTNGILPFAEPGSHELFGELIELDSHNSSDRGSGEVEALNKFRMHNRHSRWGRPQSRSLSHSSSPMMQVSTPRLSISNAGIHRRFDAVLDLIT
jgi:hypothetical protein